MSKIRSLLEEDWPTIEELVCYLEIYSDIPLEASMAAIRMDPNDPIVDEAIEILQKGRNNQSTS